MNPFFSIAEVDYAIELLRKNGLAVDIPNSIIEARQKRILFDGDDGLFKCQIMCATTYFEWGSGESTLWVCENTRLPITSVDTDNTWIYRINKQIESIESARSRVDLRYIDCGPVGEWGTPLDYRMRRNFVNYTSSINGLTGSTNLILIDGRFRVCCFLNCLLSLQPGNMIIFDDYRDRPHYHLVEEFCPVVERYKRQAMFQITDTLDHESITEAKKNFQLVWD